MDNHYDVVVVGGGIAGSALACVLARAGRSVLVLERETSYRDKIRGENIAPWGVSEIERLGLEDVFLAAGGHYVGLVMPYDEVLTREAAEQRSARIAGLLTGKPGYLNVGHPQACEALSRAAQAAGAHVLRGVDAIRVLATSSAPELAFRYDAAEQRVRARLLVGADGRQSSLRKQLGLQLHETRARTYAAGLLVSGLSDYPSQHSCLGASGDALFYVFPRQHGVARLYILWDVAQPHRFAGPERTRRFLDAFRGYRFPYAEQVAAAEPIGPCATYAMTDSFMDEPLADGAVLIGDAAGWNDPIIGQGLSIALRDVRVLAEILLDPQASWTRASFAPYVEERRERMRRLRISARVATEMRCTFSEAGRARRLQWFSHAAKQPWSAATIFAPMLGPETTAAEGFEPAAIERILTAQW